MFLVSPELHKQFQHFGSGQDATNSHAFFLHDLGPFNTLYEYSDTETNNGSGNNKNEQHNPNDDTDEARYNLATRIMSNGVEVIIASDKTKSADYMPLGISHSQLPYIKPMTLPASTIKNQMMILLIPSTLTATDNSIQVNNSILQLNYKLPLHFITKTCLTTYTYRTTYIQEGKTTVESREKVISNVATEERNYFKITPTQTLGVILTKTPELAVGIFPTTYSYFNTLKDNHDNLQLMTSEYTIINTITGPNDYVAYLQPTEKATPALKTNTYYNEVTISQKRDSTMHTLKRNLTQVVVTKSYTNVHSTSVTTSYYTYDADDSLQEFNEYLPNSLPLTTEEKETDILYDDTTQMLKDIHIYATKTFKTTFTYYTTTVLRSNLLENDQTESGVELISTVFNYYTRIIENVITDSVPATLLPNELLKKMKIELGKQNHKQLRRLIVTTATLKDGQTVKVSAMQIYKGNLVPSSVILPVISANATLPPDATTQSLNHSLDNPRPEVEEENGDLQLEDSPNGSASSEAFKQPEEEEENDSNGIVSLPSEQIVTVVKKPHKQELNANIPINENPSTTAATQLIQRLTALKPMFNAMADLLQNNFGVMRETVNPQKNIEIKQGSNKKINSSATNTTQDTKHPIYIPVPKSPIKKNLYQHTNYTEFVPQSLHIKPPILVDNEDTFETNNKEKLIFSVPRKEQPLHNGGIYIRPGEIITANSDVIIGKPNGIDYVKMPNHLHVENNTSKVHPLDNREFQVTYYHNKVEDHYKKKSPVILTSITNKPYHIPIVNNNMSPHSNGHLFNINILKPPPPPPLLSNQSGSRIPIYSPQGLYLKLTAPDNPLHTSSRIKIKPHIINNSHLSDELKSSTYLNVPTQIHSSIHKMHAKFLISAAPPPRGKYSFYNLNNELKNNEILDIQHLPQTVSVNFKPSLTQTSSVSTLLNTNGRPQQSQYHFISPHIKTNVEQPPQQTPMNWPNSRDHQAETKIVHTEKDKLPSKDIPKFVATSKWKKRQDPQVETLPSQFLINLDESLSMNHPGMHTDPKPENPVIVPSKIWNLESGYQASRNKESSLHIKGENSISSLKHQKIPTFLNGQKRPIYSDFPIYLVDRPAFSSLKNVKYSPEAITKQVSTKEKENIKYAIEPGKKSHQNVSFHQHIFSHMVDVNVPPLTFNHEDNDYLQQTTTPVRGQIPPATVKAIKTPGDNVYKYMPLITVPADKERVQISFTSLNSLSPLPPPSELQIHQAKWSSEATNTTSNFNNVLRKISEVNDSLIVFSNDKDQKTVADSNILNIKPKTETIPNWKHDRRQHPYTFSQLSNKSQLLANSTAPNNSFMHSVEENQSKLEHNFKPNKKLHEINILPDIYDAVYKSTNLKYPSKSLTPAQSHVNELKTTLSQMQHTKVNGSDWIITEQDYNNEKVQKYNHNLHTHPQSQNPRTKPPTSNFVNNNGKNNQSAKTSIKTLRTIETPPVEVTTEYVDQIIGNKLADELKQVTQLLTSDTSFTISDHNNRTEDKEIVTLINNATSIIIARGEAFKTSTKYNHNRKIAVKSPLGLTSNTTDTGEHILLPQDSVAIHKTQHFPSHIQKIFTNPTNPFDKISNFTKIAVKLATRKMNSAATETVLGLLPPPLPTTTNLNSTFKIGLPSFSLLNTNGTSPEITQNSPQNIENEITLRKNDKTYIDQRMVTKPSGNQKKEEHATNSMTINGNFKAQNIKTTRTMNDIKVTTTEKYRNMGTIYHEKQSQNNENQSRQSDKTFTFVNLKSSESHEQKLLTTVTTPVKELFIFTTTTTITIKRIILPTKYITNKHTYTVTTTASTPSLRSHSSNILRTSFLSTTETTTEVSTLFLTHTQINTVVDTITSVKTLKPIIITTTTTLQPSSIILKEITSTFEPHLNNLASSDSPIVKQMPEVNRQEISYLPYPSVEVVSTNITQESSSYANQNSIFIIMTNSKGKQNAISNHQFSSENAEDDINIMPAGDANDVLIEYDNGILFDDVHIRDDKPRQIENSKSVEPSAFVNNAASVKETPADEHVILSGVLIATPPKFPTQHKNANANLNEACHPKCKASRNEKCSLIDNLWSCFCRPGFARIFPDRPCKPTYTYELLIHVERVASYPLQFIDELKNNKTEHYKHLTHLVNNAVDRMIMQSDLRDIYHGVEGIHISESNKNHPGLSIIVLLQLSDNSNEKRLEEVIKKTLRVSNYSIGGTNLYTNMAGVGALSIKDFNECLSRRLHDCSESAHCFNLPGTYTCSCMEGFVDLSGNPIYPGRICSAEQIGCEMCHYHGKCSILTSNSNEKKFCECFHWYAGSTCHVNLKILLIVLLGIGTLLFVLLLFYILITRSKYRNQLQHTTLAPSTVTLSSEDLQKNSRLTNNMIITSVGLKSTIRGVSLKNTKRQRVIKIDKRSIIKDSSSETSQNSLPYKYSFSENCTKKKTCLLKKYRNCGPHKNKMEQCAKSIPSNIQIENQSNLNTVIKTSSSFKENSKQTEKPLLFGNGHDYEGHYCEQSDRSLTVMIPRAKYHSSALSQTELMQHQLAMERVSTIFKSKNKLANIDKDESNLGTTKDTGINEERIEKACNPGALISAGFEVSAIVRDNMSTIKSEEQDSDLGPLDPVPPNYIVTSNSDLSTALGSNSGKTTLLNEERQQYTNTANKRFYTNESDYNVYKCEKDLIETMDEWLGTVRLNELSSEARSFDETIIRPSMKPPHVLIDGHQATQLPDEINTMAERGLDLTFLLPHTHFYKLDTESE